MSSNEGFFENLPCVYLLYQLIISVISNLKGRCCPSHYCSPVISSFNCRLTKRDAAAVMTQ